MALHSGTPDQAARSLAHDHAVGRRPSDSLTGAEQDSLAAARGILYAAIGGAAAWATLIAGIVAVVQRLR